LKVRINGLKKSLFCHVSTQPVAGRGRFEADSSLSRLQGRGLLMSSSASICFNNFILL